jgi:hypothetical protein
MPQKISDALIISIINDGISILGEKPTKMIWSMLETDYGFNKDNITEDLTAFIGVLREIFGLGYSFLDTIFVNLLAKATAEKLEAIGDFGQCVSYLRQNESANVSTQKENAQSSDEFAANGKQKNGVSYIR